VDGVVRIKIKTGVDPERAGMLRPIQFPAGQAPRKFEFLSDAVSQLAVQLFEGGVVVAAVRCKSLERSQIFNVNALRSVESGSELLGPLIGWDFVRQWQ